MNDTINEVTVFSPFGGQLILEDVPGSTGDVKTPENGITTKLGSDRSMFVYVPQSGCYDAKQAQVLMVLRDEASEGSALDLMKTLELDALAEAKHFILVFPNPLDSGWNYKAEASREDDLAYLVRCFAVLPKSKGKAAGFNGMIFYIGTTEASSALVSLLAEKQPIDCAAMMVGSTPQDYKPEEQGLRQPVNAWVYETNPVLQEYLIDVNHVASKEVIDGISCFTSKLNPNINHFVSKAGLSADEVRKAWDKLFSESRRWRNDTFGTYQERTNFTEWGFVGHVNDDSLKVNNGFKHTWYEYVPKRIRNTTQSVPLLFYFHGGGCVPLYGAEQSDWHRIAEREGFIVVYPKASVGKMWNAFDDQNQPSDLAFVVALIEHMKTVHPIDESRIYITGFSMGSMMTNALASVYPNLFAAAAPMNAQHLGYLSNRSTLMLGMGGPKPSDEQLKEPSHTKHLADELKAKHDYRMPVIQFSGLLDNLFERAWPIDREDNLWLPTIDYWKVYNHIPSTPFTYNSDCVTGLYSDETHTDYPDERFIHHTWFTSDTDEPLYQFVVAKRMPHAVDLRETEIAWQFIKQFSRMADGTLVYSQNL